VLDERRQAKAREYARASRRIWLATTAMGGAFLLLWLLFGWGTALRDWVRGAPLFAQSEVLLIAAFFVVFGGIFLLVELPLSFHDGFVLPHRFDQSTQSLGGWISDQVKGLLIGAPLGLLLVELLYAALRVTGEFWWLWAAGGMLLLNVLLSNLAPTLIMPLFNKYSPLGDDHRDLAERLMRLADRARARVQGVYKFDMSRRTKAANAALTGIGNTRRIILSDTLINEFTPDEIETVLAHELGHHVHHDIAILIGFGALSTAVGFFLASMGLQWAVDAFRLGGTADVATLPAFALIMGIYGIVMMPVTNAVSRWREQLADQYALASTSKNEAFASALVRLANQNLSEVDPERWVVLMFYSHPPLTDRIAMARSAIGQSV
jgi:STE24 endopeptidase